MIDAERNYKIHNAKYFAIVDGFCYERQYFKSLSHTVDGFTNYGSLLEFIIIHQPNYKQVRLALNFSAFDFQLLYCQEALNSLDRFSRQSDSKRGAGLEDLMTYNTFVFH